MKYSIVLPYIDRLYQLSKTLSTFVSLYNRNDFEIVIVEDSKNTDSYGLDDLVRVFRQWIRVGHFQYSGTNTNPAPLYNFGVESSFGEYIVLSSPECYHKTNILNGLDEEFDNNKDAYVVCACQNMNVNEEPVSWYQHSELRNALYHFCSAMSKEQYMNIGGFDEQFADGYCFDDDDFKSTVLESGMDVVTRDDLIVCHQNHNKTYLRDRDRWIRNKRLYESKHGKYKEPPKPALIEKGELICSQ